MHLHLPDTCALIISYIKWTRICITISVSTNTKPFVHHIYSSMNMLCLYSLRADGADLPLWWHSGGRVYASIIHMLKPGQKYQVDFNRCQVVKSLNHGTQPAVQLWKWRAAVRPHLWINMPNCTIRKVHIGQFLHQLADCIVWSSMTGSVAYDRNTDEKVPFSCSEILRQPISHASYTTSSCQLLRYYRDKKRRATFTSEN